MSESPAPSAESAPAAGTAPAYTSSVEGLNASQAQAMAFVDQHRATLLADSSNFTLIRQNREALAHVFHGGPQPSWLEVPGDTTPKPDGARVIHEGDMPDLERAFTPMQDADLAPVINRAVVVGQLDRQIATETAQLAQTLQMPAVSANVLLDAVAKHAGEGWKANTPLSSEQHQSLADDCIRAFGGDSDKAQAEAQLAMRYVQSIGGDKLLNDLMQRAGSVQYSPALILQLSMLARAKGLA